MQAVNRNGSIDVLRAVMAFVVIVNHTCIFGMKMQDLLDCAVPVFLIISGYYFHSTSMEKEKRKLRKAISKISYLFVGSVFLYVTWGGIKFLFWRELTEYDLSILWTCTNLFCPPLWYIQSYLYLMVILYFVLNTIQQIKKKFCFSHLPLRIMLLISILSWIFLQIYANDNFHTHGTIICLIYWLIGLALSKINLCLSKFHLAIGCLLLAISSIILRRYGFYDGVGMHRAYYFTTALLAVSIFCFFLHVNINNSNIISRIGRVNSIHIYIVHWVLIEILFRIGNDVSPYLYFLSPLIIFFVSYVLSETYLKILVNRFPTKCKK